LAAGHATTTVGHGWAFNAALTLWICGDGFFRNISAIVATLYPIDLFGHRIWLVRNAHERR